MRSKITTWMLIGMLGAGAIVLNGCAMLKGGSSLPAPCGVNDYIETKVGDVITGVSLPTDEAGKKYNIVLPKKGFWISADCDERIGR